MKGFKTVAFGVMIAVLSVASSPEMQAFVAENLPTVGTALGTLVVVLRAVTNSPMFKKEPEAPKENADA